MYQNFSQEHSAAGYKQSVPPVYEQSRLDPKTWKTNVNFVPIPEHHNKLLRIIHKTQSELQDTTIDDTANMERFENKQRMTTRDERRRVKHLKPYSRPKVKKR